MNNLDAIEQAIKAEVTSIRRIQREKEQSGKYILVHTDSDGKIIRTIEYNRKIPNDYFDSLNERKEAKARQETDFTKRRLELFIQKLSQAGFSEKEIQKILEDEGIIGK